MFERAAVYGVITSIGNANIPEEPAPLYSARAGGNGDTSAKCKARRERFKYETQRRDWWFGNSATLARWIPDIMLKRNGNWSKSKRAAMAFMINSEDVVNAYLKHQYGDARACYWATDRAEQLATEFLFWFRFEREELRGKMGDGTELIKTVDGEIVKAKRPKGNISHGGVANLLKVLTKTMEQQGADIKSIAKMQYTVCRQAGILIPDEFIEDVAVVLNAAGELGGQNDQRRSPGYVSGEVAVID